MNQVKPHIVVREVNRMACARNDVGEGFVDLNEEFKQSCNCNYETWTTLDREHDFVNSIWWMVKEEMHRYRRRPL